MGREARQAARSGRWGGARTRGGAPRRWLLLALWVLWAVAAPLQAAQITRLQDYARDVWTSRNGLPHNTVRDIAQTPDGYLWFGTWEGVVRYNGLDFSVFGRGTQPALPDSGIGTLYVDSDGTLWLGDSRGNVSSVDQAGNWKHWPLPAGKAPAIMIEALQKDSQGRLWLLYESVGLGRLDPDGSYHRFEPPTGIRSIANHTHMAVDDGGRVWMGTYDGLLFLDDDGQLKPAPAEFGLPNGVVWPYRAPDGSVWVTAADRLYRLENGALRLQHHLPGTGALTEMLRDSHGDLWLGTENNGLWRVGKAGVEQLKPEGGLIDNRVISLHEDAEGSIWVGLNGGLMRLRETLFTGLSHVDGLSGDFVRSMMEDAQGRVWVGSSSGLDRVERDGGLTPVRLREGLRQPSVMAVSPGSAGDVWVGTRGDGVFHVGAQGKVTHYAQGDAVPRGNYRAILVDPLQRVWLGSAQGVFQWRDGHAVPLPFANAPDTVTLALAWLDESLWVASAQGAWRVFEDRVEQLPIAAANGARAAYGFRKVGDAIWITTDRGLLRYRDGRFAAVGLNQGLPVDTVFEFIPDRLGNVWVSSNRGIWRTRMEVLDAVADGKRPKVAGEMYREIDGVISAQANGSSGPAGLLRSDGSVWIATAGGIAQVNPATVQRMSERTPPPTVIEQVVLDGTPLNWRGQALADIPGGRRLSISYVGLSYLMADRIRYRTRLEGLDKDWIERGTQRAVEYVGLPPGKYVLHVSAAHPDGRWSQGAALLNFEVKPLWWQRLDVRIGLGLMVLLALLVGFRHRVHRYQRHNERLLKLVDERTRDLKLQAQVLLQANREKTEMADRLREQAEEFERQAREDALTGLPNRRAFDEVLARDFARSKRNGHALSLVVLDLDHFKRVNDTWSHAVGDTVLCEVAHLLKSSCRDSDLPARLGGEEFALILYGTGLEDAMHICDRLQALFHARKDWAGVPGLCVTFSAGLVQRRGDDLRPQALYQRADNTLYQAKNEGRDRTCVDMQPA